MTQDQSSSQSVISAENELKLFKHIHEDLVKLWPSNESENLNGGTIEVQIKSEIPLGSGLGSSAAWGASLSGALLHSLHFLVTGEHFDKLKEKEFVWSYTNFLEKLYHGSPSGCDAATSMHGGCLFY